MSLSSSEEDCVASENKGSVRCIAGKCAVVVVVTKAFVVVDAKK